MKVLFVYFSKRAICSNAQEAIDFINTLHYRDREDFWPISVNDHTRRLIDEIFSQEWDTSAAYPYVWITKKYKPYSTDTYQDKFYSNGCIRTTNCGNTDIRAIMPLADTIEEHDAVIAEQQRLEEERIKKAVEERKNKRIAELNEVRPGLYSVSLTYTRLNIHSMRPIESTFRGKCYANSGIDAYRKTIEDIEKHGEWSIGADYPESTSSNFDFYFIG